LESALSRAAIVYSEGDGLDVGQFRQAALALVRCSTNQQRQAMGAASWGGKIH
jgi:hypothetical protein